MTKKWIFLGICFLGLYAQPDRTWALNFRQKIGVGYGLGLVIGSFIAPFNLINVLAAGGTLGTITALYFSKNLDESVPLGASFSLKDRKLVDEGMGRLQVPNAPNRKVKWRLYEGQFWIPATSYRYYFVDKILEFEKF